jgi:hypothetical protein
MPALDLNALHADACRMVQTLGSILQTLQGVEAHLDGEGAAPIRAQYLDEAAAMADTLATQAKDWARELDRLSGSDRVGEVIPGTLEEKLVWYYVEDQLPDDGITVLMAIANDGTDEVYHGYRAGDGWLFDGQAIAGRVYAWAYSPAKPPKKGGAR